MREEQCNNTSASKRSVHSPLASQEREEESYEKNAGK